MLGQVQRVRRHVITPHPLCERTTSQVKENNSVFEGKQKRVCQVSLLALLYGIRESDNAAKDKLAKLYLGPHVYHRPSRRDAFKISITRRSVLRRH